MNITKVVIYGKQYCSFCTAAKNLATAYKLPMHYLELNTHFVEETIHKMFPDAKTYPQIVITVDDTNYKIGGYDQFKEICKILDMEKYLKEHVLKVHFTKSDGTLREMRCTLSSSFLTSVTAEHGRKKKRNPWVIPVYDLDKEDWRSFRFDSVIDYEIV